MIKMTNIGIFREGGLPPAGRTVHKLDLIITRCSLWNIYYWQHDSLLAPFWRLYWNDAPGGSICFNNQVYTLDKDKLILVPPHTSFSSTLNINRARKEKNFLMGCPANSNKINADTEHTSLDSIRHLFIHFTAGFPYDHLKSGVYSFEMNPQRQRQLDDVLQTFTANDTEITYRTGFTLRALINDLLAQIPEHHWPVDIKDQRILRMVQYLQRTWDKQISNNELAGMVSMSTNGFARLFKQETSFSPKDYATALRLQNACHLLHNTDKSIDEIAEVCGFCDRSYFSRMFIKKFKTGPAEFRKSSF